MRDKYIIRYESIGGDWHYCIYKTHFWFGYSFFERWNKPESARVRLLELLEGNE